MPKIEHACEKCGTIFYAWLSNNRRFCSLSCAITVRNKTHGKCDTRLYKIWGGMLYRCRNPASESDARIYQGITVCREWEDFEVFYDWAIANGYSDDLSIDRKDGDLGYNPENCWWATKQEQSANTGRSNGNGRGIKSSDYRGVRVTANGSIAAQISREGTMLHLGTFSTEEAAARARDAAAKRIYGDAAKLNFNQGEA